MRRVVLDPGVLVSALITPAGAPAKLLQEAWVGGLQLVVSPLLLGELERVLAREKFRRYVDLETVREYVGLLRREALCAPDPGGPAPMRCADPDDEYLVALAQSQSALLVSGDRDLLDLAGRGAPILAPADLLASAPTQAP